MGRDAPRTDAGPEAPETAALTGGGEASGRDAGRTSGPLDVGESPPFVLFALTGAAGSRVVAGALLETGALMISSARAFPHDTHVGVPNIA